MNFSNKDSPFYRSSSHMVHNATICEDCLARSVFTCMFHALFCVNAYDFVCVCVCVRVGNMLFSVETQTTDERTQQYQSEIEALYKDLTAKGKTLMLSTELGVRTSVCVCVCSSHR